MSEPTWKGEPLSWWRTKVLKAVADANAAIGIPTVGLGVWYLWRIGLGAPGAARVCGMMAVGVGLAIGYWRVAYGPPTRLEPAIWSASAFANFLSYWALRHLGPASVFANPWPGVMIAASLWLLWTYPGDRAS